MWYDTDALIERLYGFVEGYGHDVFLHAIYKYVIISVILLAKKFYCT